METSFFPSGHHATISWDEGDGSNRRGISPAGAGQTWARSFVSTVSSLLPSGLHSAERVPPLISRSIAPLAASWIRAVYFGLPVQKTFDPSGLHSTAEMAGRGSRSLQRVFPVASQTVTSLPTVISFE